MAHDEALLRLDLPDRDEAPAAARKALTSLNGSLHLVSAARLRDVQLLVSELVANAIRHGAGSTVSLRVDAGADRIRVEVHDYGSGFDPGALPAPSTERGGGWGLPIVAALAPRWGVDAGGSATTVWFEFDRPQREAPLPIRPGAVASN